MAKSKFVLNLANVQTWQDLRNLTAQALTAIIKQLNGRLTLQDNFDAQGPLTVVFTTTNMAMSIVHNLNRVPLGFIVVNQTANMGIYASQASNTTWTDTVIYLSSSAIGTAKIFIL
jgi:hypothetical protein